MIDVTDLTKRFGRKTAVDDLSFSVRAGMVTGFLGPNGAGKSTTMRLILGLDRPNNGRARVNGRTYKSTKAPMTEVGALLDSKSVHPGRTARNHLRALAATHGISRKRVDEVIEMVGLESVARKRAGTFSPGMSQRLGLAIALLGDPQTLILDEPMNGLDPQGVAWLRNLLEHLSSEGRTVFVSSHLISEMAQLASHLIIIGRGQLIADSPTAELAEKGSGVVTRVRSPELGELAEAVKEAGHTYTDPGDGSLLISGLTPDAIGDEAAYRGWAIYEMAPVHRTLEEIYMELTHSVQEFQAENSIFGSPMRSPSKPPVILKPPVSMHTIPHEAPVQHHRRDVEPQSLTTTGSHRVTDIFRDDDTPPPDPVHISTPHLQLGPVRSPQTRPGRAPTDSIVPSDLGPHVRPRPMGVHPSADSWDDSYDDTRIPESYDYDSYDSDYDDDDDYAHPPRSRAWEV
jgi:ABC-2 type transport system ATP-binding protein